MTTSQRLERDLPLILDDLAVAPYPDYIDDVLTTTAGRRQRPTWTFPERWLPMDLVTQRVPTPSLPWRALGVLALMAILIGAALAVYMGSRPRLPDPFGPAANGVVSYESGGTIYLFDPASDTSRVLTTDAEGWIDPWFSPDGRTLLLAREINTVKVEFGALPVDGGDIRVVTPEPVEGAEWLEWSPESDRLILISTAKRPTGYGFELMPAVSIMDTEAGTMTTLDLDLRPTYATFIPPSGERILVVAESVAPRISSVWSMLPDGSDQRLVLETEPGLQMSGRPSVAPDGGHLAYGLWDTRERRGSLHLFDIASGTEIALAEDPAVEWIGWPRFSPDGRTLFVERAERINGGPTDGTRLAFVDIATERVTISDLYIPEGGNFEWSPDGSVVVASVNTDGVMASHVLVDPVTGRVTPAPWTAVSYPSWQRTAP